MSTVAGRQEYSQSTDHEESSEENNILGRFMSSAFEVWDGLKDPNGGRVLPQRVKIAEFVADPTLSSEDRIAQLENLRKLYEQGLNSPDLWQHGIRVGRGPTDEVTFEPAAKKKGFIKNFGTPDLTFALTAELDDTGAPTSVTAEWLVKEEQLQDYLDQSRGPAASLGKPYEYIKNGMLVREYRVPATVGERVLADPSHFQELADFEPIHVAKRDRGRRAKLPGTHPHNAERVFDAEVQLARARRAARFLAALSGREPTSTVVHRKDLHTMESPLVIRQAS